MDIPKAKDLRGWLGTTKKRVQKHRPHVVETNQRVTQSVSTACPSYVDLRLLAGTTGGGGVKPLYPKECNVALLTLFRALTGPSMSSASKL